jgi:UDP-N-acetylmuramate dehydrogenase
MTYLKHYKEDNKSVSNYRRDVELKNTTWFRVGGNAEILFRPNSSQELSDFLTNNHLEVTVLGLCSNVIIRDGGIKGMVIKLGKGFTSLHLEGDTISAGCALTSRDLALFALDNSLTGLEFLIGIPGSVGGAVAMNSGCYSQEISDSLIDVEAINRATGRIYTLPAKSLGLAYRHNDLSEEFIFTQARFKLSSGTQSKIKEQMDFITQQRASSQPIYARTGGSTFKNPLNHKAWELIDKVGLRGYKLGHAQISEKHANFLISTDGATARELESLGELVRETVLQQTGVSLEWEIKRIGIDVIG